MMLISRFLSNEELACFRSSGLYKEAVFIAQKIGGAIVLINAISLKSEGFI